MSPQVETIAFIFSLVALGYIAGWTGYLKEGAGEALSDFAVKVALPLLLFRTMLAADFHGAAPWALWGAYFSAVALTWVSGQIAVVKLFGRDARAGVVGGVTASFSNLVLLGIPFVLGVFGQSGFEVLSLLISVHLPVMMAASILMFQIVGREPGSKVRPLAVLADFARKLVSNPLIVAILSGLAWRALGLPLPGLAVHLVDALAGIAGPLALFAMGLGLRAYGVTGNVAPALTLAAFKLALMPAFALGAALLFGLPPLPAQVAVAAAALPAGVNSYLIATQFGTGQRLASSAMVIGTASAVVTTAFWIWIAGVVWA